MIEFGFPFQAIDLFMSSCMIFVFLSLIEYAFVNVMMGDISDGNENEKNLYIHISKFYNISIKLLKVIDAIFNNITVERKDKTGHLRNIIVTANSSLPPGGGYSHRNPHLPRHPSQQTYLSNYRVSYNMWKR